MRIRYWALSLLLLMFVFMLYSAPARLLAWVLPAPQIIAQGFHGGLWRGSADSVAVAVQGGYLQLGRVSWDLSPLSLLLFSPRLELDARWGPQRLEGDVTLYPGGDLRLRETELSLDAAIIKRYLPINVDGQLSVLVTDLELEDQKLASGSGRLVWQRARWFGSRGPAALGDYVAEFEIPEPGQVAAQISTLGGPIKADGNASLFGQALTIDARLTSEEAFHPELAQPLQLVASPIEGGFHLKLSMDI